MSMHFLRKQAVGGTNFPVRVEEFTSYVMIIGEVVKEP